MASKRSLVLTLDAFGTLFRPRESVFKQYADAGRRHGLSGFSDEQVEKNFKLAFQAAQLRYPNYGKGVGMGASKWWFNVIEATFKPLAQSGSLPSQLAPELIHRFSTSEGYELYPDVQRLLSLLSRLRRGPDSSSWETFSVGVVTDSDDRVPLILHHLGLKVGARRYSQELHVQPRKSKHYDDIDFVVMSYDVGTGKPCRRMFEAAEDLAGIASDDVDSRDKTLIHVGDEVEKDFEAAERAGWKGILLGGHGRIMERPPGDKVIFMQDLGELEDYLLDRNPP